MATNNQRSAIAGLSVSAVAFAALVLSEGYTDRAVVPTVGDRPTVGFGSTFRDDGSPVQIGDTITPQRAVARSLAHIQKDEAGIKRCITAPLLQREYDLMVDFAYQYGTGALCSGQIAKRANAGDYLGSCQAYIDYRFMTDSRPHPGWEQVGPKRWRFDCATPGNKTCRGVWTRQLKRYTDCMEVQA